MCRPTTNNPKSLPIPSKQTDKGSLFHGIFPIHPSIVALGMATLLPSWFYLNRGFTVWFHIASMFQVLTQSGFLVDVLFCSGTSICLGWYASIAYEYFYHGRFCHALYLNMPSVLVQQMVDSETNALDFDSTSSLQAMAVCHVLDILGHPLLTYYFWKKHQRRKGKSLTDKTKITTSGIFFEWPVILSAYAFSRTWSFVHTYHNYGSISYFYIGRDVYVMDDMDSWYPAYIIESLFYIVLVSQIFVRNKRIASKTKPGKVK